MSQRLVPLKLNRKRSGQGLELVAPPSATVAPPGFYMLFVLNRKGVPSEAEWVGLGSDAVAAG